MLFVARACVGLCALSVTTLRMATLGMNVLLAVTTSVVMMVLFCLSVPVAARIIEACLRHESTPRNAAKT